MSYFDKPRFHKPVHPARQKPPPADPLLEPCTPHRLPLLCASRVPTDDAPPLLLHAQAGIEMQQAAKSDEGERKRQQGAQRAMLADAKHALRHVLPYLGVRCAATQCSTLARHPAVQAHVFRSRRSKHICPDPAGNEALRVLQLGVDQEAALSDEARAAIAACGGEILEHPVVLDWDYWSVDQILRAILPVELAQGAPSAFSMVGHIAHVNLREEYLAYRYLIGELILEKTPRVETVVNKLDTIDTEFRVFAMELLAGEPRYEAQVSESNCLFTLDFRHVYWNSRLHTEHARLIQQFQPFQVVADVMAGVGPFAVPAAKKGVWVLANDLNPACFASMQHNVTQNKVEGHCHTFNEDGHEFIRASAVRAWDAAFSAHDNSLLSERQKRKERRRLREEGVPEPAPATMEPPHRLIDHFVMNLPATALEFLDAFRGLYVRLAAHIGHEALLTELDARRNVPGLEPWPMVHVHCFTKDVERAGADICQRASAALGLDDEHCLQPPGSPHATPDLSLHLVRSVAPNKDMYCLSFRLPESVLFDKRV
ncbi:tRNA (guanine(37)-N(1))-methyltransferase [Malassezia nana]|uniref:tRNA (guanine(37)-N1)-methyltransferase n=1 Tax=Malassezia nana TaxID=180528 RepID=A0AAF0J334_9BASI|nr:tRNA (guanine(37)-N(1))-methyltransferase [Malassezia nana]